MARGVVAAYTAMGTVAEIMVLNALSMRSKATQKVFAAGSLTPVSINGMAAQTTP